MYDILIRGGQIIDGSGQAPYRADLAISGDRIAAIDPDIAAPAATVIDARDRVVAPGFIDIHSHTDETVFISPLAPSKLLQGVTSEVVGNCGIGLFPVTAAYKKELEGYAKIHNFQLAGSGIDWQGMADYANHLNKLPLGPNLLPLVAHGPLRIAALGSEDRAAAEQELAAMKALLAADLQAGAWGLSAGLIYPPGSYADTAELSALASVLAPYGAMFSVHVRGESDTLLSSIQEAIDIAQSSGALVEISHLKAVGEPRWGLGPRLLQMIETARSEGALIAADQYPYEASSTTLTTLIPDWAHAGGIGQLLGRLTDHSLAQRLKTDTAAQMELRGGPAAVMIANVATADQAHLSGLTLADISAAWELSPVDTIFKLLLDNEGSVGAVYFSMSGADVEAILANPDVAVGSDGFGQDIDTHGGSYTHPRSYGTFPRVLGHYVRERRLLPLETAVYKMTGLPASRLGLTDRGLLQSGWAADITVFDPATVIDRADFVHPHRYAAGIDHVLVNGAAVVADGQLTGLPGGRVLRKQ